MVQVCPECAPAEKKDQVVDVILGRTLSDVTPELGGLDDLVITNPSCGHVFTVETLDGLTEIGKFYTRDGQDTKWIGLKAPLGIVKPPACPTCRAPITCNRYGRITKRAKLDILERNVAFHMSQSLYRSRRLAREFDEGEALTRLAASKIQASRSRKLPSQKKLNNARKFVLNNMEERPTSDADICAENKLLHYVDPGVLGPWSKETGPLLRCYREIVKIADTRSAHTQAWEAAFSFLYNQQIEAGLTEPHKMPRNPEQHAMRMASIQVGQPRPLADRRFLVEAFWETLHIRLSLIRLAQSLLDKLPETDVLIRQWATYTSFLLDTCSLDVTKALQVAEDSKSHSQIIKSNLLLLQIELETFRFNLHMCKKFGTFKDSVIRDGLREKASEHGNVCEQSVRCAIGAYLKAIGPSSTNREWLEENFMKTARLIVNEWRAIEQSIRLDVFYQPVSVDEKIDVIRAFSFGNYFSFRQESST